MTNLGGWVGSEIRISWLEFVVRPDADLAYQWDTKRKLFSLAEVCTPPSTVLVSACDVQVYICVSILHIHCGREPANGPFSIITPSIQVDITTFFFYIIFHLASLLRIIHGNVMLNLITLLTTFEECYIFKVNYPLCGQNVWFFCHFLFYGLCLRARYQLAPRIIMVVLRISWLLFHNLHAFFGVLF